MKGWDGTALDVACDEVRHSQRGIRAASLELVLLASAEWAEPKWSPMKGQYGGLLCLISRSPWKRLPQVGQVPLVLPGFSIPTFSRPVLETSPTVDGGLSQTLLCLWGM